MLVSSATASRSSSSTLARPRRAPPQGPLGARARSTSSATTTSRRSRRLYQTNLPVPPTPFLGPGARARRRCSALLCARRRPPPHADRARRHGQDAARGSRRPATSPSSYPRRRLVGSARSRPRPGARARERGHSVVGAKRRPRRAHRRQARCSSSSTTSSRWSRPPPLVAESAFLRQRRTLRPRHEPRCGSGSRANRSTR